MDKEKTEMKKKSRAKMVTLCKRRKGIFKKAEELSILCDADVALIIISSAGKLFQYSSSSMDEILERYGLHSQNLERMERPSSSESQQVQLEHPMLSKEAAGKMGPLRKMIGEHLQDMNTEELEQLEKSLEAGLSRLQMKTAEKITTEIESLQQKGRELMEENSRLKHQKMVMEMARGGRQPIPADLVNTIRGEAGPSSESAMNSSRLPPDYESSDTSLKLGLNYG